MTIAMHTCSLESTSSNVALIGGLDPPITLLLESSIPCLLEDDPTWHKFHDVLVCGLQGEEKEEEDYLDFSHHLKKPKKDYELTRKFQMDWSAKAPWSEMILNFDGIFHIVKCNICNIVRGRPIIMQPK
jgi:hypothetical protein